MGLLYVRKPMEYIISLKTNIIPNHTLAQSTLYLWLLCLLGLFAQIFRWGCICLSVHSSFHSALPLVTVCGRYAHTFPHSLPSETYQTIIHRIVFHTLRFRLLGVAMQTCVCFAHVGLCIARSFAVLLVQLPFASCLFKTTTVFAFQSI